MREADGFVAIKDINPRAEVHLLVIPERHVPSFREIGEFEPEEAIFASSVGLAHAGR